MELKIKRQSVARPAIVDTLLMGVSLIAIFSWYGYSERAHLSDNHAFFLDTGHPAGVLWLKNNRHIYQASGCPKDMHSSQVTHGFSGHVSQTRGIQSMEPDGPGGLKTKCV